MHVSGVSKCNRAWMTTKQTLWYCNHYCKIIVTNGDVKLIDKNKMQNAEVVNRLFFGVSAYGSLKTKKKSKS